MKKTKPKVSVICITYNHANFIRQALDGFVMQKTNFPFEVIVHDDASTDKTADIIREYQKLYPDIIKPIFQTENQFSRAVPIGSKFIFPCIRGKYVAKCDGDDYWTDENKLQKQVDFLDSHPDFAICATHARLWYEDGDNSVPVYLPEIKHNKTVFTINDLLKHNMIVNSSVMYRWQDPSNDLPVGPYQPGDWMMHLMHARHGRIKVFRDVMVLYRKWSGGIWDISNQDKFYIRNGVLNIQFWRHMENIFGVDRREKIREVVTNTLRAYISADMWDAVKYLRQTFPDAFNDVLGASVPRAKYEHVKHTLIHIIKWLLAFIVLLIITLIFKF